jgi:histone-lysine N-methyltransferase MLL3
LPQQLANFHSPTSIYPIGYKIARFYWSRTELGKRKKYICSIHDKDGHPEFVIQEQDRGVGSKEPQLVASASSARLAWREVIEPIAAMSREHNNIKVFVDQVTGDDLFGLNELTVIRILESMHGVDTLSDYNFRFNRNQLIELPLAINPTGCARTEPYHRSHSKRPHAMHTSSPSRLSIQSFSPVEVQSPYVKTFVHSKPSMYRKMKTEWRNNVYLARSRIAGLGLFAARDIAPNTMVIEYIGQLIRNEIAERNEKLYEQQVT